MSLSAAALTETGPSEGLQRLSLAFAHPTGRAPGAAENGVKQCALFLKRLARLAAAHPQISPG